MSKDKDYFIENLAMLLSAGIGINEALHAIRSELQTPAGKKELDLIIDELDAGSPFWRAIQKTNFVSPHVISLIRLGEESGRLSQNLEVVVEEEQKNRALRSKIKSAMLYPVLIISVTVAVGLGVAWFILPKLATVFEQLKIKLPFLTKLLISAGTFLGSYGYIFIPVLLISFTLVIYFLFFNKKTKFIGESLLLKLPGIGRLFKEVEIARFGYMLGTLLEAGLTIDNSLNSLAGVASVRDYQKLYMYLRNSIEEGNSFQKTFLADKKISTLIPVPIQHMIVAGEVSGKLSKTLLKIGEIYTVKTDATTRNIAVLLEPLLLVFVWLAVVGVALAIVQPIYNLIGGLNS